MTYDPRLLGVKRDVGIFMRFPTTGEPQNKYYEENRKSVIDYHNSRYEGGWVPDQPVGWWVFRKKTSSDPVPPFADEYIIKRSRSGNLPQDSNAVQA